MVDRIAIIGAGLAGAKAAQTLREEGFDGSIVLVGAESEVPYERPPLSKGYLTGAEPFDKALVHEPAWYTTNRVELRPGTVAASVDPGAHVVALADGASVPYDRLLLATGAAPVRLPIPGADLAHTLRTKADSDALRTAFQPGQRVVLIGGGWIGLELASAAVGAGCEVTVVEQAAVPLAAALGPEVAGVFAQEHQRHGVQLLTGVTAERITDSWVVVAGDEMPADVVVSAVGARPVTGLAEAAGLSVDNGIVVDAALRASAPDIYAAGDVASAFHPRYGRHLRVEHWDNAAQQGPAAARSMLGQPVAYDRTPYFYTDQYDLGMEYVGWVPPDVDAHAVLRGDIEGRSFQAFWLVPQTGGGDRPTVAAAMHVNMWDDGADPLRRLVESDAGVDPVVLADADAPLSAATIDG